MLKAATVSIEESTQNPVSKDSLVLTRLKSQLLPLLFDSAGNKWYIYKRCIKGRQFEFRVREFHKVYNILEVVSLTFEKYGSVVCLLGHFQKRIGRKRITT
jgi:flagellin-specific chaperone FliS